MGSKISPQTLFLLWSPSQQAFDKQTLEDMLRSNWDSFFHHQNPHSDWIVVGFGDSDANILAQQDRLLSRLDTPDRAFPDLPFEEQL